MSSWLSLVGWRDVLDVAVVAVFAWLAIRYFRRTRTRAAAFGLALIGVVYVVARGLELRLTESILQGFFAVLVLVLVIVFQDDLRRAFEQLGSWRRGRDEPDDQGRIDLLARTVTRLASTRTGALIVLPGSEPLERHLEGGVALGGRLSEPLLLSLFDSSSPGHDGAVVLRGSRVERFAVHLPLSANHAALGPGGTRHAAGLGLAERSDATCIIVSEERGTVSVARGGELRTLSRPEDLVGALGREPETADTAAASPFRRGGRDVALALAAAVASWLVFVPGSDTGELAVEVPVEVSDLPSEWVLETVEPRTVSVLLRGLRRDLVLVDEGEVHLRVDARLAALGRRTFTLSEDDVRKPGVLSVVSFEPSQVRLSLVPAGS